MERRITKKLIHKNESEGMEPLMRAIKAVHTLTLNGESMETEDLIKQRNNQDLFCRLASPSKGVHTELFHVQDIPCEWIRPEFPHNKKKIILYCHGGGYTCGSLNYCSVLGGKLAQHTGCEVATFAYGLAPENPYPKAINDGMKVWDYLMHLGYGAENVILAGDSAGGNLALEITLHLKESGRMLPKALVLMSPWTDMTMSGNSYVKWAEKDPMLTKAYVEAVRKAYAPDADYTDWHLSPMFGNLEGMPRTLVQVGSNEILRSDSENLVNKMKVKGCNAVIQVYKGGWHVFQQMPILMASKAMDEIGKFVEESLY